MEIAGASNARERTAKLLKDVGLANRGHHYPSELSGGEQQRVAIARAFANEPKILLADEPTGNLDSKNGQHVFDLMTELRDRNDVTLVLVTHDIELAKRADRQIVLRDGEVVTDEMV
jgi:putative ABC transport system ATP-binding protein